LSEVPANGVEGPYYRQKLAEMAKNDLSTLTVNYSHLKDFSEQLAKLVSEQYVRLEPFLRKAIQTLMIQSFPEKAFVRNETEQRNFQIAFTDVDAQYR
jgi:DNA replication licensing factor MCM6